MQEDFSRGPGLEAGSAPSTTTSYHHTPKMSSLQENYTVASIWLLVQKHLDF